MFLSFNAVELKLFLSFSYTLMNTQVSTAQLIFQYLPTAPFTYVKDKHKSVNPKYKLRQCPGISPDGVSVQSPSLPFTDYHATTILSHNLCFSLHMVKSIVLPICPPRFLAYRIQFLPSQPLPSIYVFLLGRSRFRHLLPVVTIAVAYG